jgi:xylulokinase
LTGTPPASYDQLQREAEAVACGSEGVLFVPHFSGRVLPSNPNLKGSFVGLDFRHTRAHLYRSVLESVAYEYQYYLAILKSLHPEDPFDNMLTVGGGAKSSLFNQIKADVLGVEVKTYEMGETALIGSAVIAGVGVGLLKDYKAPILRAIRPGETYLPDERRHRAYEPYASAYLETIDRLTGLYKSESVYHAGGAQ